MNSVGVVILNYKVRDLVLKCVKSVKKSTYGNIQIIVIDNDSKDGLEEKISKEDGIVFIQSGANLGYAGGNNLGIKKALDLKMDYVLVLNPDTTVDDNAIFNLISASNKYNAAVVGPKIYFSNSRTILYAGGTFDYKNVLGDHRGVNEKDTGQYEKDVDTEFVTGAAIMVRADVFENIGLFDERYFLYYEDSDFCYRARKKGFKVMYIPSAEVFHDNARSTGLGSPLQDYFITRNRMLFASKFLPYRARFALLREALRNMGNSSRRMALSDFLMGKFGKGSFIK